MVDGPRSIPGDPISLVAAEIHLGPNTSGHLRRWLHCNIQIACHSGS
jgi:hypothetical protein